MDGFFAPRYVVSKVFSFFANDKNSATTEAQTARTSSSVITEGPRESQSLSDLQSCQLLQNCAKNPI